MASSPAPPKTALTVGRLACRFAVPAGLPRRVEAVDRMVQAIERGAPQAVARRLGPALGRARGVIRVRRLRLEAHLDLARLDEAAIGERLGALIALALARELSRSPGTNRREFPSRAAYLAAFVVALRRGQAWHAWWFDEFRWLRPLSTPGAAVFVLAREPAELLAVLRRLEDERELEPFLASLDRHDLDRLWQALGIASGAERGGFDAAAWTAVARAAAAAPAVGRPTGALRARALRLLALAGRGSEAMPAVDALAGAALRFAELEAVLAVTPELGPLIATRAGLYPALRRRLAATGQGATLAWLEPLLATQGEALARAVPEPAPAHRLASPVGGLALLLPALAAAGLWPHLAATLGEERARAAVFVLLLKPLGRTRALLQAGDPLLASLAGLDQPPMLDARLPREAEADPDGWPIPAAAGDASAFDLGARFGYPWLGARLDAALSRCAVGLLRATAARCAPLDRLAPAAFVSLVLARPATLETRRDRHVVSVQAPLAGVGGGLLEREPLALPWLDRPVRFRSGSA